MAIKTLYTLNSTAVTPNFFGNMQDSGTAPSAAASAYGWTVAKTALTIPYWRGRFGATGLLSGAGSASSWIDNNNGPTKGTGSAATTAGDSFISPVAYTGVFAAGNWVFNFGMRTGAASHAGRIRCRVWASKNADGTGARYLNASTLTGSIITLAATATTYTSTVTWTPGTSISLNGEYLFFQVEWQITTVGSSNSCSALFYQSACTITTPDYTAITLTADAWNAADQAGAGTLTLSNADKTVAAGTGTNGIRSTQIRTNNTGKYYAEYVVNAIASPGNYLLGLNTPTVQPSTAGSNALLIVGSTGNLQFNGSDTGFNLGSGLVANDVIGVAWDSVGEKIYVRKNAGLWNNNATHDPVTAAGGINASALTGSDSYGLWFLSMATGNTCTVRTEYTEFTQGLPSGFNSWMADEAWSTTDQTSVPAIALTNVNKTATVSSGAGAAGIRSVLARANQVAGTYYVEFVNTKDNSIKVGIKAVGGSPSDASLTCISVDGGSIVQNGLFIGNSTGTTPVAGDIFCMAWDAGTERIWFRVNAGNWNNSGTANPATGVGGLDVSAQQAANYALWFRTDGGVGFGTTLRSTKADLTVVPPVGFTSWMGEALPQPTASGWNVYGLLNGTLSNGDKTVTLNTNNSAARSTQRQLNGSVGKFYAEFVVPTSGYVEVGASPISNTTGANAFTFFIFGQNGNIYVNNVLVGSTGGSAIIDGDIVSIAWDTGAEVLWCRKNAGYWNNSASADPATGVGGIDASVLKNEDYMLWAWGQLTNVITIRTEKAEFTQTTPTGFLSWMGETLVAPNLGVLASGAATLSGSGVVSSVGTGALNAQSAGLVSNFALSSSIGAGALSAVAVASSNYASWSQNLDDASWSKLNVTVVANAIAAPDGSTTAESVTSSSGGSHYVAGAVIATPLGTITASIYAKAGTGQWIQLYDPNTKWANFDLINGVTGYDSGDVTARITAVGNGWYRCSITFDKSIAYNCRAYVGILNANSPVANPAHASVLSDYLWGAQLEVAAQPSAYLPTQGTVPLSLSTTLVGTGIASWNATGALSATTIRTNLVPRSQELELWTPAALTVTANDIAAPDATTTAERFTDDATYSHHYIINAVGGQLNKRLTYSVYAKAGTLSWLQFYINAGSDYWVNFNIATGVVGQMSAGLADTSIQSVGNGWYRCSATFDSTIATLNIYAVLKPGDVAGITIYQGTGTGTLYLWGAQLEQGAVATAYIPTSGGSASVSTGSTLSASGTVTTPPAFGTGVLTTGVAALVSNGASGSTGAAGAANEIVITGATTPSVLGTGSIGQTFIATGTSISKVKLYLDHSGSSAGDVQVKLRTVDAGHMPLTEIGSASVVLSSIPAAMTLVEFTFSSPVAVTSGTEYAITAARTAAQVDGSDVLHFYISSASIYAGGQFVYNGGSWISVGPYDIDCVISFVAAGGLLSSSSTLAGAGISQVVATGALTAPAATLSGSGLSESRSTSAALQAQTPAQQLGSGLSGSTGAAGTASAIVIHDANVGAQTFGSFFNSIAQSFVATGSSISRVQTYLSHAGAIAAGDVQASIITISAGHVPVQPEVVLGVSSVVAVSSVSPSMGLFEFTFSPPVSVTPGTEYAISITRTVPAAGDDTLNFNLIFSDVYSGGSFFCKDDSGGNAIWQSFGGVYDLDCVISFTATGGLQASSATLSGAVVLAPATGTGALPSQSATLVGTGISQSLQTSAALQAQTNFAQLGNGVSGSFATPTSLAASVAVMAGVGTAAFPAATGTGTLPAQAHTLAGAGVSSASGTGVLVTSATLAGFGIARSTGTGVLTTGVAALSGAGVTQVVQTSAALVAQAHTLSGAGVSESRSTSAVLNSQSNFLQLGNGVSAWVATGTLSASQSALTGGVILTSGTGTLSVSAAVIVSAGLSQTTGTGTFAATVAALAGVGLNTATGTGALTSIATLSGSGVARWIATGTLAAQSATTVGPGLARWVGTGTLAANPGGLTAAGISQSKQTASALQASVAFVSGFEGVTIISGTGILPSQIATGAGAGISRSLGTGALPDAAAALAGAGLSGSQGASLLAPAACAINGAGTSIASGTAALNAGAASALGSGGAVTAPTGTGVLLSGVASATGSGQIVWTATGSLSASVGVLLGAGTARWTASGTLIPAISGLTAAGLSASTGTAPLLAARASLLGAEGVVVIAGSGDLQAQSRLIAGVGTSRSTGAGSLSVPDSSVLNGPGTSGSIAVGTLVPNRAILAGTGAGEILGTAALVAAGASLNATGAARWLGSGAISAQSASISGAGLLSSRGTGVLQDGVASLAGAGVVGSVGAGAVASRQATLFGSATLATAGSGELVAQDRLVTGVGLGRSSGSGVLRSGATTLEAAGISRSTGSGVVVARPAKVAGFAVLTAYGVGVLTTHDAVVAANDLVDGSGVIVAGSFAITGFGLVEEPIYPEPAPLPGSYPGTRTYGGAYIAGYRPMGIRGPSTPPGPWWWKRSA